MGAPSLHCHAPDETIEMDRQKNRKEGAMGTRPTHSDPISCAGATSQQDAAIVRTAVREIPAALTHAARVEWRASLSLWRCPPVISAPLLCNLCASAPDHFYCLLRS